MGQCLPERRCFLKGWQSAAPSTCRWSTQSTLLPRRRHDRQAFTCLSTLVLETDRDPRMGRNMEGYTEDPYLDARIAENIVHGAQGRERRRA